MFEYIPLILQSTFVDSALGLMSALLVAFMVISAFAIFWARKAKAIALARGNQKLADMMDKVINVLQEGQKVANATANQEEKLKQFGEILYNFMGPEADKIRDKYKVKLEELTKDVQNTTLAAKEREAKMKNSLNYTNKFKGR